jgi:hypothetical protein
MTRKAAANLLLIGCAASLLGGSAGGCFLVKKPDKANIALRKQNQEQQSRIKDLELQHQADAARIQGFQQKTGTLPTLPQDRLDKLFTTHDLKLGKLTGGADLDPARPGQEGLKVHATPVDQDGDRLKAAGSFTVEAFDVSGTQPALVGKWTFDAGAARKAWTSVLNRYEYLLTCPWQTPPRGTSLHLSVTFVDELTNGTFTKTVDVTIEPPAAATSGPSAAASTPGR